MKTTTNVKKWGNSLAVRIPTAMALDLGLSENSDIQLTSDGLSVTIVPQQVKKADLDELIGAITPASLHASVDAGPAVGGEAW